MKAIGIDPGYDRCGVAVVARSAAGDTLVMSDCLTTSATDEFCVRLATIGEGVAALIHEHRPDALALERLYFNSNQKTALQVAEVRGMLRYIAAVHRVPVFEYSPQEVKLAVTGYGKSDKQAMARMTERLLKISKPIKYDDEHDAIAVGLTCLAHRRTEMHRN